MRDYEFRGKTCNNKDWQYGYYYYTNGNLLSGKSKEIIEGHYIAVADEIFISYKVDPETIGQYIGLTDKDKQKVYEGDILQDYSDYDNGLYVVEFMDGKFVLINDDIIYDIEQVHYLNVIGNIHDNKELLNGGAK